MRVRATKRGRYDNRVRSWGDVFALHAPADFDARWMVEAPPADSGELHAQPAPSSAPRARFPCYPGLDDPAAVAHLDPTGEIGYAEIDYNPFDRS